MCIVLVWFSVMVYNKIYTNLLWNPFQILNQSPELFGQYGEFDGSRISDLDSSGNMDNSMESTTSVASVTTDNVAPSKIGSSRRIIGQDSRLAVGGGSALDGDGFGMRTQGGFNSSYVSPLSFVWFETCINLILLIFRQLAIVDVAPCTTAMLITTTNSSLRRARYW